jgi:hypothetical protein
MAAFAASCAAACSAGGPQGDQADGFTPPRFVTRAGYAGTVLRPEERFGGYAVDAGRLTLLDTASAAEVWGKEFDEGLGNGASLVAPLPDFSGLALATDRGLRLVGPGLDLVAGTWTEAPAYFASAAGAVAFAGVTGGAVEIARLAGDTGNWQRERLALPWDALKKGSSELSAEELAERGPAVVAAFRDDGAALLLLRPADGAYVWLSAADASASLAMGEPCPGKADVSDSDVVLYRGLALLEGESVVAVGDRAGRVVTLPLDPAAACVALDAAVGLELTGAIPVTSLTSVGEGTVLATQAGGPVHLLAWKGGALESAATQKFACDYPLGGTSSGSGGYAVVCYDTQGRGVGTDAKEAPAAVTYFGATLQTLDAALAPRKVTVPLDLDGAAAMAVGGGRVVTLLDNALGVLEVTSLEDGATERHTGLFVEGVLD